MELKVYQQESLDKFDLYLEELVKFQVTAQKIAEANTRETDPDLIRPLPDFPKKAWDAMRNRGVLPPSHRSYPYVSRKDGTGNDVPSLCLKIPTGGGKTLLGAYSVSRIMGNYLKSNRGFVLWIVPNEAIYAQTKRQLTNREHPIRQILNRAAAGRVKILEKDDPLNALDVESNLCVMLLMLQSANRVTKETLRLFRDRGNVHGFFPAGDDIQRHWDLIGRIPNLDCYGRADTMGSTAKDSLGNVLRLLRPIVVVDEGHKGYTEGAMSTINGFNPSFVLELSATPKEKANWLVDVRGTALQAAEMIKLPINVKVKAGDDWKDCLRESLDKLNGLQQASDKLRDETARYIRPILLVQVERTGKEQRDGKSIHAEDAREFLLSLGMDQAEIALKTADTNELDKPENANLLSSSCRVRVIITKSALQEGWDCPFAYVLCTLATNRNLNALTQLVGRIMRQPEAARAPEELSALNECYIYCHHAGTKEVVDSIKKGLENDGMSDLAVQVRESTGSASDKPAKRKLARRENFRTLRIFLPMVKWVERGGARPLDYEQDVLYRLDWDALNLAPFVERLSAAPTAEASYVVRVGLGTGKEWLQQSGRENVMESASFDSVYATRLMVDVLPNPWVARALVGKLIVELRTRGLSTAQIDGASGFILEELRQWLLKERDRLAEAKFREDVAAERIQFRLRADQTAWELPTALETDRPVKARKLVRQSSGGPIEKSVFAPVYEEDFNPNEAEFACYLDEQAALQWWHRNVAKSGNYHLQGWKKNRVYPDFIFAHQKAGKKQRIVVWETKGDQLEGNLDSVYKRKLLDTMTQCFKAEEVVRAGELELVSEDGTTVICEMVLMSDWKAGIHHTLAND
jgi:type III restriction enzyme